MLFIQYSNKYYPVLREGVQIGWGKMVIYNLFFKKIMAHVIIRNNFEKKTNILKDKILLQTSLERKGGRGNISFAFKFT